MNEDIKATYGNRIRIRTSGIAVRDNAILLVKHEGVGSKNILWAPPGGGVEPGELSQEALRREFFEETGLKVEVRDFLFVNEFIEKPLHAVELFFKVKIVDGCPQLGTDPEMAPGKQILKEIKFVTFRELAVMDNEILHNALHHVNGPESLLNMSGYFKFCQ
ncbi:NUDIX hydrolase family protein [Fulvivirga imtechensis AK7]|uniref:NUDIX hydrolase family protein n=1 Tax=Fulvivirga imtechensis AK7 TaxID=1237149 RepID=L8JUB2_9BACT|nr:NUDIX hydrolase [Fulvivirga imtechensis]ELR71828.1 NUDIX hydrolase family protein [Fulvivirga imtechensis AK7]